MAKGSPSLVALLGLLAVAGYQNRDKLRDLIQERPSSDPYGDPRETSSQGGIMDTLRSLAGGAGASGMMGGLGELFDRFAKPHQQAKMQSWVQQGPNAALSPVELEEALDEETIPNWSKRPACPAASFCRGLARPCPTRWIRRPQTGNFRR
jgi:uncharacterized protein YidB (DUF937 family)